MQDLTPIYFTVTTFRPGAGFSCRARPVTSGSNPDVVDGGALAGRLLAGVEHAARLDQQQLQAAQGQVAVGRGAEEQPEVARQAPTVAPARPPRSRNSAGFAARRTPRSKPARPGSGSFAPPPGWCRSRRCRGGAPRSRARRSRPRCAPACRPTARGGSSRPCRRQPCAPRRAGSTRRARTQAWAAPPRLTKNSAAPTAISMPPKKRFCFFTAPASRKKRCIDAAR
jgi:hypothetical protein